MSTALHGTKNLGSTRWLVILILTITSCVPWIASGSPPMDFFRYTSLTQGKLESLEGIYRKASLGDNFDGIRLLELMNNQADLQNNNYQVDLNTSQLAWHLMEQQALLYMENKVKDVRPTVAQLLREAKVSPTCESAISGWLDRLAKLDLWASVMWNSWADFPPAGVFEGSFTDLGSYPGCLSIPPNEIIGEPQYCMLDYQPIVPTRPRFHHILKKVLAVDPQTGRLTAGDFALLEPEGGVKPHHSAHEFSSSTHFGPGRSIYTRPSPGPIVNNLNSNNTTGISQQKSYTKRTIDQESQANHLNSTRIDQASNLTIKAEAIMELASKAQYFYYVKFRMGTCWPSKCSLKDIQNVALAANGSGSGLIDYLLLFSVWTNSRKLFDVYSNGSHADLEVIHGFRFFSMIWVIYGHTILYTEFQSFTHFFDMVESKVPNLVLLPSLNANFSVDTFFVISGVLTTYVTWEFMRGDPRKFNKIAFAVSRYIRLTPQVAIIILFFFLLPLAGEGPLYKQVTEYQAGLCYKGWLTNLLYLQSYSESEKICMDPSWWLSIEMTFHLVSILVISVMVKNATRGLVLNFAIAIVLTLWGAFIHYTNGFAIQYMPSIPQRYEVTTEQTKYYFHKMYPHAASYFIGTGLGYLLATRTIKRLTRAQLWQGWIVCVISLVTCLWGTYYWNLGAPYTQLQATLYNHLCQILWPIAIAWILFVSSLGQGGLVHSILAAPIFAPLGRITYMTYLSHALIIYYHSACRNVPTEPSVMSFVYSSSANILLSLALGTLLTVLYESPILNLQKRLIGYLTRKFMDRELVAGNNHNHLHNHPNNNVELDENKPSSCVDSSDKLAASKARETSLLHSTPMLRKISQQEPLADPANGSLLNNHGHV